MDNKTISFDGLENAFMALIDEFVDECVDDVNEAVVESSKVALKELRNNTPDGAGKYHDWKEYQKGWKRKTEKNPIGPNSVIIYNGKKPGLTHLLEKGHVNKDGSRAKAFPHIEEAAEKAIEDLERRLNAEL